MMEALLNLRYDAFARSLAEGNHELDEHEIIDTLQSIQDNINPKQFPELLNLPQFNLLYTQYTDFCEKRMNPMAKFWNTYIDMVNLLLQITR